MIQTTLQILMTVASQLALKAWAALLNADGTPNYSMVLLTLFGAEAAFFALYVIMRAIRAKIAIVLAVVTFVCQCMEFPIKALLALTFVTMAAILANPQSMAGLRLFVTNIVSH